MLHITFKFHSTGAKSVKFLFLVLNIKLRMWETIHQTWQTSQSCSMFQKQANFPWYQFS